MNQIIEEKLNGFSVLFRFVTPVLVTISIFMLGWVRTDLHGLTLHFTNHLEHHQDLEVGYERRLTTIEQTRFTFQDGKILEAEIMNKLPPKWLLSEFDSLKVRVRDIEEVHKKELDYKVRSK